MQGYNILLFAAAIFLVPRASLVGQESPKNKYGLAVITTTSQYQESVSSDASKQMVNLRQFIPTIVLDLKYASDNNFMHQRMYPKGTSVSFMRKSAADALRRVQLELADQGLGLKVFDAYRPYSVTEKFWELVHDDRYVANPAQGSGHNRGVAVDLTIIDLKTGKEIPMPTGFDNFTDSAHRNYMQLSQEVLKNRSMLETVMKKYGFEPFPTEWWHFSLPHPDTYEVLDLSFKQLLEVSGKP